MYKSQEIVMIFSECKNFEEVLQACRILKALSNDYPETDLEFIQKISLLKIEEL